MVTPYKWHLFRLLFRRSLSACYLLWLFIAVFLHVFVDIFNAYGTQALRPFTKKWVALGIINTFDTVIFLSIYPLSPVCLSGAHKGYTALAAYILMFVYYIGRIMMDRNIKSVVYKRFKNVEKVIISPSYKFYHYHLAVVTTEHYYVARWHRGNILVYDKFNRVPFPNTAIMQAAVRDEKYLLSYLSRLYIAGIFSIMITIMKFDLLICGIEVKIIIHSSQSFSSIKI